MAGSWFHGFARGLQRHPRLRLAAWICFKIDACGAGRAYGRGDMKLAITRGADPALLMAWTASGGIKTA